MSARRSSVPTPAGRMPARSKIAMVARNRVKIGRDVFSIPPAPVRQVRGEKHVLPDGSPDWRIGAGLKKTQLVHRTLVPGSVRVRSRGGQLFARGRDYLLDAGWAKLTRAPASRIGDGETVYVDYAYRLSRIDLVQRGADGVLSVKRGKSSLACPLRPRPDKGRTPVASVYLAPETATLTKASLYPIEPRAERLLAPHYRPEAALERMESGKATVVVCFGDSITHYGDASSRESSYFGLLRKYLRGRFPKTRIELINAGVGGNSTDDALKRIDQDVLRHRPHLVTIMFGVNDENGSHGSWQTTVPLPRYRRNIREMVRRIRAAGSEAILMSQTFKNPKWEHTSGHIRDYQKATAAIARRGKLPFADVTAAWLALESQGIPFMPYLSTCINHPNDHGHRLIFEALKRALD